MVAIDHRLSRRIAGVMNAAVIGALAVVLVLFIVRAVVPPNYSVSVMFYADKTLRTPEQHRRALEAQLRHPGFLERVVVAADVPVGTASELARTLQVRPTSRYALFTQMVALGHDADALERAANSLADALVEARAQQTTRRRNARLALVAERSQDLERQRAVALTVLADAELPGWARTGALVLGALDGRRFGLELDVELKTARDEDVAAARQEIDQTIAQLELHMGGPGNVDAGIFDAARLMASLDDRQSHLIGARQDIRDMLAPEHDLHVINRALVAELKPAVSRTIWGAVFGAALGALFVVIRDTGRPSRTRHRGGPTLESHVHVAVIGSMAGALVNYGERKMRPLAQAHPSHLAIDGVRSLQTALQVLAGRHKRAGPVIIANADATNNAGHVLSNLAILAADRGERVLIIETGRDNSVLSQLFTTGTRTTLSTTVDEQDISVQSKAPPGGGRIRFMIADDDSVSEPPVPGAFVSYFNRIIFNIYAFYIYRLSQCNP